MIYVEAPGIHTDRFYSVFMAGGITDCPDWQTDMVGLLKDSHLTLFNPRRKDFPIHDPGAAQAQIEWEFRYLRRAEAIMFWFPRETLCPIVLYELGAWSNKYKSIFVGTHPDYARRQDVIIQTSLVRPGMKVVDSLEELASQVIDWQDTNWKSEWGAR